MPGTVDAAVINAAMGGFYSEADWRDPDWTKGDFVVVFPSWATRTRPAFVSVLDNLIVSAFFRTGAEAELKLLEEIKSSIQHDGDAFDPGPLQPVSDLVLDDRIKVSFETTTVGMSLKREVTKNRAGKEGTIRTHGSLYPPAYSRDGRYAFVYMVGLPYGFHSAKLAFLLERTKSAWKVIYVRTYSTV